MSNFVIVNFLPTLIAASAMMMYLQSANRFLRLAVAYSTFFSHPHWTRMSTNCSAMSSSWSPSNTSNNGIPQAFLVVINQKILPLVIAVLHSAKAKGAAWPNHPVNGCLSSVKCRSATKAKAGAPGPPFRYL